MVDILEVAVRIVQEAGEKIKSLDPLKVRVWLKNDGTRKTEADDGSDKIIKTRIQEAFPEHSILSEEDEESHADKKRLVNPSMWLWDPLDGTDDFLRQTGDYAVSLSYLFQNKQVISVIYLPAKDKLYTAQLLKHAFLNHKGETKRIASSSRSLEESIMTLSAKSYTTEKAEDLRKKMQTKKHVLEGCRSVRICSVAEGNADWGFIDRPDAGEWDSCAELILKEAGGNATDYDGNALTYNKSVPCMPRGIIFTNGKIHEAALLRTREYVPFKGK